MCHAYYVLCLTTTRLLQVARHDGLPPRLPRRPQAAGQGRHATAGPDHIVRPPPPPLCRPLAATALPLLCTSLYPSAPTLPRLRPRCTPFTPRCRCASSIAQHAGIAALEAWPNAAPGSQLHTHVAELREKRDLALGLLRAIPALTCPTPQGAFYLLPDVSAYFGKATPEGLRIGSAEALCMALLDKYKVAAARCSPARHGTSTARLACALHTHAYTSHPPAPSSPARAGRPRAG